VGFSNDNSSDTFIVNAETKDDNDSPSEDVEFSGVAKLVQLLMSAAGREAEANPQEQNSSAPSEKEGSRGVGDALRAMLS